MVMVSHALYGPLHFSASETAGAYEYFARGTVYNGLDPLQIRDPEPFSAYV